MRFNLITEKTITNLPKVLGYRMGDNPINILCYSKNPQKEEADRSVY